LPFKGAAEEAAKEAAKEAEECAGGGISSAPKADLSYLIPAAPVSA